MKIHEDLLEQYWQSFCRLIKPRYRKGDKNTLLNGLLFFFQIWIVSIFYKEPLVLFVLLIIVTCGVFWINCYPHAIFYYLGGAVVLTGMIVFFSLNSVMYYWFEGAYWRYGLWNYFFPLWFIPFWGNITLIIRKGDYNYFEKQLQQFVKRRND